MKRPRWNARIAVLGFVTLGAAALGCAHKIVVEIPPRIDLQSDQAIGIVEFSSDSQDALNQSTTQKFMSVIQQAQPRVRFLELGSQADVLKAVGRERIDPDAIKAIGAKYKVKTVFSGAYDISELKPKLGISSDLSSLQASMMVQISLAAKQWETASGATIWTNAREGEWSLATVDKGTGKTVSVSVSDPETKYGRYLLKLVHAVTDDFRPHYERRPAPKN